jgi:N-acyl-D-amino-acid deacylase
MFDAVIHSGSIIDGSGSPAVPGALAVKGDKISALGDIPPDKGRISIDATGQVICPGFIDTHSHSDVAALQEPALLPKLMQGVTTDLLGQDGIGPAPLRTDLAGPWKGYLSGLAGHGPDHWDWQSFDDYLNRLSSRATGINLATLLPAGNVRMAVLGLDNVPADKRALAAMKQEVRVGMTAGALGMSLGMVYLPCTFFSMDELNAIFSVCADLGGIMVVHMRSSSNLLIESVEELLILSEKTGIPLHLSHLKASGRANWPKMSRVLEMIDEARAAGAPHENGWRRQ